jgi:hypothetical protein
MILPRQAFFDWQRLHALDWLNAPVWVFDVERLRVLRANRSALALWCADSLEQLQERDFGHITSAYRQHLMGQTRSRARFRL